MWCYAIQLGRIYQASVNSAFESVWRCVAAHTGMAVSTSGKQSNGASCCCGWIDRVTFLSSILDRVYCILVGFLHHGKAGTEVDENCLLLASCNPDLRIWIRVVGRPSLRIRSWQEWLTFTQKRLRKVKAVAMLRIPGHFGNISA